MRDDQIKQPRMVDEALSVDVVDGEIVLDSLLTLSPSLTPEAARETARRLVEAADRLQPL